MKNKVVLSIFSGILMWLGWPMLPLTFLLFIGFVPLLILHDEVCQLPSPKKGSIFFRYVWLAMFVWNVLTTWWVWNASAGGAVMAIVANSLLMTIPFAVFHKVTKYVSPFVSKCLLIVLWVCFEYCHQRWDLTWTWINIGNAFAIIPNAIQWYEYTGALGGTLWVLFSNVLVHQLLTTKSYKLYGGLLFSWIVGPVLFSLSLIDVESDVANVSSNDKNVVIVQPNIDPYEGKFDGGSSFVPYPEQIHRMIVASDSLIDKNTRWVIWPETSIQKRGSFRESMLEFEPNIQMINRFLRKFPDVVLVAGISTWDTVNINQSHVVNPYFREDLGYYKRYNTSMIATIDTTVMYHKSKLVPGVEKTPFPKVMKVIVDIINFDGSGDFGVSAGPVIFENQEGHAIAPTICYESIYGEHVAQFVKKGANYIAIITNDGWWGDTPGFKQHNLYARLRAIENRRMVLRSANTGTSSVIDQFGVELIKTAWWKADAFKMDIKPNGKLTFYTKYGDWLGVACFWFSIVILFLLLVQVIFKLKIN